MNQKGFVFISSIGTKRNASSVELMTVHIIFFFTLNQNAFYSQIVFFFFFRKKPVRLGAIYFEFKVGCLVMKSQTRLNQIKPN